MEDAVAVSVIERGADLAGNGDDLGQRSRAVPVESLALS